MSLSPPIAQVSGRVNNAEEATYWIPDFPTQVAVALDFDQVAPVTNGTVTGVRLLFARLTASGAALTSDATPARYQIAVTVWPCATGEMRDSHSYNSLTICDPAFAARIEWDAAAAAALWAELQARGLTRRV